MRGIVKHIYLLIGLRFKRVYTLINSIQNNAKKTNILDVLNCFINLDVLKFNQKNIYQS